MSEAGLPFISVVIIGRNEGERLIRCIEAVQNAEYPRDRMEIIYADSDSDDGSLERAAAMGVTKAVPVITDNPCAAEGRNRGYAEARGELILFLDGDTILNPQFLSRAVPRFEDDQIAVVFGKRVEIDNDSLFIRLCGLDWQRSPGFTDIAAGDILVRKSAMEKVGTYMPIIAGEDPEFSNRIVNGEYKILHIGEEMVKHDLAIHTFGAYWKHSVRSGFAYAAVASITKNRKVRLWQDKLIKNTIQGSLYILLLPVPFALSVLSLNPFFLLFGWGFFSLLVVRTYAKNRKRSQSGKLLWLYSVHSHFIKIPLLWGQVKFLVNRKQKLIEYK